MTLDLDGHNPETVEPYVRVPQQPSPVVACVSRREGDENYPVLARLDGRTRVIECRDALQWIVQKRAGQRWVGVSFHRNRDVLIERSGAMGEALAILQALPEMHP